MKVIVQTFRIMKVIDDLEASNFFTMNSSKIRGHGMKIMKQTSRLNLRKFGFSHRVVIKAKCTYSVLIGLCIGCDEIDGIDDEMIHFIIYTKCCHNPTH